MSQLPFRLSDYDYNLPKEKIAQTPCKNRSESKLLHLNRRSESISHHQFKDMGSAGLHALGKENHVLYDIKYILPLDDVDGRL